jgi:hypothetical protein
MTGENAQQLDTCITGATNDTYLDHSRAISKIRAAMIREIGAGTKLQESPARFSLQRANATIRTPDQQ